MPHIHCSHQIVFGFEPISGRVVFGPPHWRVKPIIDSQVFLATHHRISHFTEDFQLIRLMPLPDYNNVKQLNVTEVTRLSYVQEYENKMVVGDNSSLPDDSYQH